MQKLEARFPAVDPRQRMNTSQIAKELARSRQSLRKALDAAGVPYMSKGAHCPRYYARSDLDAFIASHTVIPKKAG